MTYSVCAPGALLTGPQGSSAAWEHLGQAWVHMRGTCVGCMQRAVASVVELGSQYELSRSNDLAAESEATGFLALRIALYVQALILVLTDLMMIGTRVDEVTNVETREHCSRC